MRLQKRQTFAAALIVSAHWGTASCLTLARFDGPKDRQELPWCSPRSRG
jgi:hypothetical protein